MFTFFFYLKQCPEFERKYIKLLAFKVDDSSQKCFSAETISEITLISKK